MPPFSVLTEVHSVTGQQIPWKRKDAFGAEVKGNQKNNGKSLVERKNICTFAPAKKCIALALRLTIP